MDPILTGAAANNSSETAKGIFQEVKRHFRCVTTYKKNVDKFEEKKVKDLEEEKANNKCFIGLCPSIKSRYQLSRKSEEGANAFEGLIQQCQFTGPKDTEDLLLAASRDQDVVRQFEGMYDQNTFSNGCNLDDKDASDLFKKIVGGSISPELQAIGDEIAKRCGGLPLAISAVARTLRNKDQLAWTTALSQLQTTPTSTDLTALSQLQTIPSWTDLTALSQFETIALSQFETTPFSTDVSPAVYAALKLCYNHIEGVEVKRFFLLCSMVSHDFLIESLLRYAIGLGLFPDDYTMEEARDRMLRWVHNLKAYGLLLDSYSDDRIDMHDIVCDVAISIASEENNHVLALKQKDRWNEWPRVGTTRCSWINLLRFATYAKLPDVAECPQLSFLHISGDNQSTEVPSDFFKEMKMLQVLDLANMNLTSFPSSIGLLSSLQTLCLDYSALGDITVVGELKALEILSLSNSDIEKLPEEIGQLLKLRVLDLRGCTKLKIIPPGLISRLTKLEELYMGDSFAEWEVEVDAIQRSNASLNELSSLSHLTTLEVHIRDAKMVPGNFFIFQKFKKYKIFIGDVWEWSGDSDQYSNTLKLQFQAYASIDQLHLGIKMMLERTEDLCLDKLKGVKIALQEFIDEKGFPNLKNLHIQNSLEIQYIILDGIATPINLRSLTLKDLPKLISFSLGDEKGSASKIQHQCLPLFDEKMVLPCLEKLQISRVNVERIWDGKLLDRNQKLTRLIIEGCDNLKHLLSASMARSLVHLKYFEVVGCRSLREIISMEVGDNAPILFPQLNSLKMGDLNPEFKGFIYNAAMDEENPPLSSQALFNKQVALPSLEDLTISGFDNLERVWDDQQVADSFRNVQNLVVEKCKALLSIFPFNMSERLQKLRTLVVEQCDLVEEIIEAQVMNASELSDIVATASSDIAETIPMFEFPQLTDLRFSELPKLRSFYSKIHTTKWPSLEKASVFECENLERIFASISEEEEEEERQLGIQIQPLFWTGKDAFHCLKELELGSNGNLRDIWLGQLPPNYTSYNFLNLKVLQVEGCEFLNHVFPFSVAENFVHLEILKISYCDNVEEVMVMDKFVEQGRIIMVFPKLKELSLFHLSKVMRFCNGNYIEFPMLEKLEIQECHELTTFVESQVDPNMGKNNSEVDAPSLFNDKVAFPSLIRLGIYYSHKCWGKIWHDKLAPNSFGELAFFTLKDCNGVSSIFSLSTVDRFEKLQNMELLYCKNLEWIIEPFGLTSNELSSTKVVFPGVKYLGVVSLPNLKSFTTSQLTKEAFPKIEERYFRKLGL